MAIARGVYTIESRRSGKLLDAPLRLPLPGTVAIQWDANGGDNQKWELVPLQNGNYHIVLQLFPRMLLAIGEGSRAAGSPAIQWPQTGRLGQEWALVEQRSGYYSIINWHSSLALDVEGNRIEAGVPIVQWYQTGAENQQWRFHRA